MRKSKFSEEQIIAILAEQERGMSKADVCRRHGALKGYCLNTAIGTVPMFAEWRASSLSCRL